MQTSNFSIVLSDDQSAIYQFLTASEVSFAIVLHQGQFFFFICLLTWMPKYPMVVTSFGMCCMNFGSWKSYFMTVGIFLGSLNVHHSRKT